MVKIKFDHELDQTVFKDKLREKQLIWRVLDDYELVIFNSNTEKISQTLSQMFYSVDLKPLLIERLINHYYYYDFDEMNSILAFAAQMLLTDQYEKVTFLSDLRATMMRYFSLDSSQPVFDYGKQKCLFFEQAGWLLDEVTARAIDEKKQDEHYQVFLQSLREYVRKSPIGPVCFVKWQKDNVLLFKENGHQMSRHELKEHLLKTPIYIFQFAHNEDKISPFLALNPKQIVIYPEDETDPVLTALQNIFDERIVIIRNHSFPFEAT